MTNHLLGSNHPIIAQIPKTEKLEEMPDCRCFERDADSSSRMKKTISFTDAADIRNFGIIIKVPIRTRARKTACQRISCRLFVKQAGWPSE